MNYLTFTRPIIALAAILAVGTLCNATGGTPVSTVPWTCNTQTVFGTACVEDIGDCQVFAKNFKEYCQRSVTCCTNSLGQTQLTQGTCYNTTNTQGDCCQDLQSVATICAGLTVPCVAPVTQPSN